jgi:hypothetical protein
VRCHDTESGGVRFILIEGTRDRLEQRRVYNVATTSVEALSWTEGIGFDVYALLEAVRVCPGGRDCGADMSVVCLL